MGRFVPRTQNESNSRCMKLYSFCLLCLAVLLGCQKHDQTTINAEEATPQYEELDALAFATQSVINMREEPDFTAELGTQALMGTPIKLHHEGVNGYWNYVETPDGYKAWCNELAVRKIDAQELREWKHSKRVIVTAFYTFFLEEPADESLHVGDGCWGCIVQYLGEEGDFTKVLMPSGKTAYVPTKDVADFDQWVTGRKAVVPADASEDALEVARKEILNTALKFIGIPYLWGGTSIKGVDCSGLVKTVYYLNGYLLLRNCSQIYKTGIPIDVSHGLENLLPADLVFFGEEATEEKPLSLPHMAIYMGDGKIIHSSNIVRVNSLVEGEKDFFSSKPLRAVRIIGSQDTGCGVETIAASDVYYEK